MFHVQLANIAHAGVVHGCYRTVIAQHVLKMYVRFAVRYDPGALYSTLAGRTHSWLEQIDNLAALYFVSVFDFELRFRFYFMT